MTTAQAIALPTSAIVQHKSGKLYRVGEVRTQPILYTDNGRVFDGEPFRVARLGVVGQRDGRDFGPIRSLRASDCTAVV